MKPIDILTLSYLEAVHFTDAPEDAIEVDLTDAFISQAKEDCIKFYSKINKTMILGLDLKQLGHDFWLTRQKYGTGFWARTDISWALTQELTILAESFPTIETEFKE